MSLLLLLSALLSALTGVGSARAGASPQAVCSRIAAAPTLRAARAVTPVRPVQGAPTLVTIAGVVGASLAITPAEPIFAGRRRE